MYLRHYFPLILFSILFLFFLSCKEDTVEPTFYGSIEGRVIDSETNQPITNAAITTSPPTSSIITDSNGEFIIENIPTGSYSITAKKHSYTSSTISISVKEGDVTEAVLILGKDVETQPSAPEQPLPENKAENQDISITLSWSSSNNSSSDSLKYDVYLYSSGSTLQERVAENLKDTIYVVENLKYNTTYFWQVAAKDTGSEGSYSSVWSFKTKPLPNYSYLFSSDIDGDYEIFLGNDDGTTIQLTDNASKEIWPQFISSTSSLVYVSDADLENHIYVKALDSNSPVKITRLPIASYNNVGIGFDVSPTENYIIYGNYDKLYRIEPDGQNLVQLAVAPQGLNFREVSYSEQEDKIVALLIGSTPYESFIYMMDADGSNMELLVNDVPGALGAPSFTVDGSSVIYTVDISGNETVDGRQLNSHIYRISLDTLSTKDLSFRKPDGTNDLFPRYSSNGSKIIFMNGSNSSKDTQIWIMDSSGENRTLLFEDGKFPYSK